jgi:hypothetical protein
MIVMVDNFLRGKPGVLRRGNRLDQARIVISDIADARAHRQIIAFAGARYGAQLELRDPGPFTQRGGAS